MIPISSVISSELVWSKISYKCGYELKRNGEIVGTLQRKVPGPRNFMRNRSMAIGSFAAPVVSAGSEIVDPISGTQIAVLQPNWSGGGTLHFTDGATFRLTADGFWHPVWNVLAANGQPVLSTDTHKGESRGCREGRICPKAH